mgnify:CR=1 FL=1
METITAITEVNGGIKGFVVKTTERRFVIGIGNVRGCCERWGSTAPPGLLDFVGATIEKGGYSVVEMDDSDSYDTGGIATLCINTSKGTLELAVFNYHNGYYGHAWSFKIDDETKESGVI